MIYDWMLERTGASDGVHLFLLSCFVVSQTGDWFRMGVYGFMMGAFSFRFSRSLRHDLLDDFERWSYHRTKRWEAVIESNLPAA
jgi:hypothetical protein